jgi:hypothetical protein
MSRRSLLIGLLAVVCASAAPAGEIKFHVWPVAPVPQEIAAIPVLMDIGFWIQIVNQDAVIKLQQITIHTYEGCTDLLVRTNTNIRLSCTIEPTQAIPGTYTCSVSPADIDIPGGTTRVCARLTNANLAGRPGGTRNVRVATVTIRVVPRVL